MTTPTTTMQTLTITFSPQTESSTTSSERTSVFTQFLYSTAPTDQPSNTPTNPTASPSSSPPSSTNLTNNAFWAVLSILILLLVLAACAFPLWYCLRKRHKKALSDKYPGGTDQPPLSPRTLLLSYLTAAQQGNQHHQQLSPLTHQQQLQLLHHLSQSTNNTSPISTATTSPHSSIDPNTSATSASILARLAALNNPSILGAIMEDSTQFTASSLHPRPPPVNQNYQRMMDRRMEEMRLKKEAEIEGGGVGVGGAGGEGGGRGGGDGGDGGVDAVVGEGKKVRFREQEWAVLGSDLSSVGGGGVSGHLGGNWGR